MPLDFIEQDAFKASSYQKKKKGLYLIYKQNEDIENICKVDVY